MNDSQSFHDEARYQLVCAKCRQVTRDWDAHHVVSKERCRQEGAYRWDPDNALRLCSGSAQSCHERHTTGQERVPLSVLRDENFLFAARSLGAGAAYVYLGAQYAGSDPRHDALADG